MDEQKKQKVLLAVLGVLVLGAGSYYFLIRDSGGADRRVQRTGTIEKRERKVVAKDDSNDTKKARAPRVRETMVERGTRERAERERSGRAGTRHRGREDVKIKKKKTTPAA